MFTALVRVTGTGPLADFRDRVRSLLVRDPDAEDYSEHHAEGMLEYRFAPKKGIPFPAFAEASADFAELRVEAEWDHDGVRGRAVIEAGRVVDDERSFTGAQGVHVEIGDEARLALALVCERAGDAWLGYAASAERHTYFRYRDGALSLIAPDDADRALEDIAFRLVDEWLWYDEEEAPAERARYAQYGHPVRGANVKSEKLALLRRASGAHSTLGAEVEPLRAALVSQWLNRT
ncbi:MAG: hypothetical protein ABR570_03505 [Burkholderiales bacterium]